MINVAKNGGFCFGVQRAVKMAEEELAASGKLLMLGEIIHNQHVTDDLAIRGGRVIEDISEAKAGDTVLIRAHGCPPEVYEEARARSIFLLDATCPDVKRVQQLAKKYVEAGEKVFLLGDRQHPEVQGIFGWGEGRVTVLAEPCDVESLPETERAVLLSQTTMPLDTFEALGALLQKKCKQLTMENTICNTTARRQQEAKELARKSDCVLVMGSKSSANTRKLHEIAAEFCKNTYFVENTQDLPLEKMPCDGIISIIAGASTPNWMMMEVLTRMNELEKNTETTTTAGRIIETHGYVEPETPEMTAEGQDFMNAIEETLVPIRSGQVLTGTVVQVTDSEISVNIGYKSDGFIPWSEFSSDPDVDANGIHEGDEIEVEVIKVNDSEGNVLLSHKSVEARKAWDAFVDRAEEEGAIFEGMGREVVKGGLIAYIEGVRTFIPASQVSNRYVENLGDYVGKPLRLKILEVDRNKRRVVASQKQVLQEEAAEKKKEVWGTLEVGQKRMGIVRRLTDFGAFVDIGDIDGLVHVTEMAWGRVKHPRDIFSEGDEIEVIIKALDPERERISLGYKELQPDPWDDAAEKFPVGSVVEGKVVRIKPFGAFVSLAPRIDGLIHISQVATHRIEKVEDELKIGQMVRAKVLSVDPEAKRISLSSREVLKDEEAAIEDMVSVEDGDGMEEVSIPAPEAPTSSLGEMLAEKLELQDAEGVSMESEVVVTPEETIVEEAAAVVEEPAEEMAAEETPAEADEKTE